MIRVSTGMDPDFEKIYMVGIYPMIDRLQILWKKHGFNWLEEISGGLSGIDTTGVEVTDYKEFHSLSGEEQYAFYQYLKQQNKEIPCLECGDNLIYCEECKAYHHRDEFKMEHKDFQKALKAEGIPSGELTSRSNEGRKEKTIPIGEIREVML